MTIVCLLSCFSLFIVAVDNYALSKLDKIELYNNSMIICTTLKKTINLNDYIDTKIRGRIDNHKQQHQEHNYEYQQWLPVTRQSTEWCAQNNFFKFEIDLDKKNKTYHDLIQYKNSNGYRKRYDRYLQYLKYGWYEGYSVGYPGSEMDRYTNNDNITTVPYGCWFNVIQDISLPTPQHYHHNQHLQHDHDKNISDDKIKIHSNVIWINIGKKCLIHINTMIFITTFIIVIIIIIIIIIMTTLSRLLPSLSSISSPSSPSLSSISSVSYSLS
jgi:hypothetical protein